MNSDKSLSDRLRRLRLNKLMRKLDLHPPEPSVKKPTEKQTATHLPAQAKPEQEAVNNASRQGGEKSQTKQRSILIHREEESEIVLRRLISLESHWQDMKPYAWDIFDRWPNAEIGGKMIELAYLHGRSQDLTALLLELKTRNPASYFAVGVDLRPYIVLKLWQQGKEGVLNFFLHQKSFQGQLLRIEKLYVFWSLYGCTNQVKAWQFLTKSQADIFSAVQEYGPQLNLRRSLFDLELGKLAYSLGKQDRAREFLEQIPPDAPEFKEALDMLIKFKVDLDRNGHCLFGRKLASEGTWQGRIKLFRSFFQSLDRKNGIRHQERNALNQILRSPSKWFPESAEAWNQLSQALLDHVELEYLLPNLFAHFKTHQMKFHAPIFERAIWEPMLYFQSVDSEKVRYWRGVANLHKFVANGFRDESLLWLAKESIDQTHSVPDALSWSQIHHELMSWLSRTPAVAEGDREEVLARVRVVGHYLDVTSEEISAYITKMNHFDFPAIDRLMDAIRKRQDEPCEIALIHKKAQLSHFTNQALGRLWQLHSHQKRADVCWRIATILHDRKVLNRDVEQVWILSGEKRREQTIRPVPVDHMIHLYGDWSGDARMLAESLLLIGAKIPELLSTVDRKVRPIKRQAASKEDRKFEGILSKTPWLIQGKRVYSSHPEMYQHERPIFIPSLPETPWVRVMIQVADRLGVSAWRWQLSWLHDQLEMLIPKLHKIQDGQAHGKIGKWLRGLSPLQRKAWYQLLSLSSKMDNSQGFQVLGDLIFRVTTVMYQDHLDALGSVSKMECSARFRWNLEKFIISDTYSKIRHTMASSSSLDLSGRLPASPLRV
ncbi:hypothetical protein [Pseudobacteriovorax antillogorgiicola]|uniref:Uncharacterized protein n=1 Tax=Pseudobacteriovorax antillogorgiicola TaxID=1513793 RepID=A0A1Y6CPD0_9BACT|nr:hypothetical protein [Pseudobacteriovorax antillogorgiicola]TCS44389.1 hypothetical protein EDD56_13316 [Pseudobacteriovorax antillogorgiicola]SMF79340.1 hypothetical protein SAMN06296036_13358 [Pseudobacteriovorax antillogorgiicola]